MSGIPGEGMTAAAAVDALLAAVETSEEGKIAIDLLLRAGLVKECVECEELHRSAGLWCAKCRLPVIKNSPPETRWGISYETEDDVRGEWRLRHGLGMETLILAINDKLGPDQVEDAQGWAAGVLTADYGVPVLGWEPDYWGQDEPQNWLAATQTG
ncbi:hypothetical protein AB0B15_02880 [Streptomyces sp. NPDC045456]|uniref:hypothetical protein n=1 Tax=Streptomyces sp. NPDC045456 TaxID=3155254 RepID=UPI003408BB3E